MSCLHSFFGDGKCTFLCLLSDISYSLVNFNFEFICYSYSQLNFIKVYYVKIKVQFLCNFETEIHVRLTTMSRNTAVSTTAQKCDCHMPVQN